MSISKTSSRSLSNHNLEEVEKVFDRFDTNKDGKISASEMGHVLRALGSSPTDDEIKRMMDEIDTDGDGFIDLKEFADFHMAEIPDTEAMKEAFDAYDQDKDGLITADELHRVLAMLGERCSIDDCKRMIVTVDSDGDGCVNFDEFKTMMNKKNAN
ncbi:hypothetical protein ACLOJK_030316 [Asimina triloba]